MPFICCVCSFSAATCVFHAQGSDKRGIRGCERGKTRGLEREARVPFSLSAADGLRHLSSTSSSPTHTTARAPHVSAPSTSASATATSRASSATSSTTLNAVFRSHALAFIILSVHRVGIVIICSDLDCVDCFLGPLWSILGFKFRLRSIGFGIELEFWSILSVGCRRVRWREACFVEAFLY